MLRGHHSPYFLALALLAILAELAWRMASRRGYDRRIALSTLGVAGGYVLFGVLHAGVMVAIYSFVARFAPVHWPAKDWRTWAVGFLLVEFAYYWFHRWGHFVRWMWASHMVHHSSEQLTLLSAIRLGWTNLLSGGWAVYLPVVLMGFDPRVVMALLAFDLHFQFFLHTEAPIRLGPLEWVLNTPTHHKLHHALNTPYLDRNFGGVLIIFDRMFGTFAAETPGETPRFGLVRPLETGTPWGLALGEWRRLFHDLLAARGWRSTVRAAFGRPNSFNI